MTLWLLTPWLLTLLLLPASALADRIHLTRGDTIDADSWHASKGMIYYARFGGEVGIPSAEVRLIEKASTDPTMGHAPEASTSPVSVAPAEVVTLPAETATPPVATKAALLVYWDTQKREAIEGMQRTIRKQALCRTPGCFELATTQQLRWTQQWRRATREYDAASRP